MGRGMVYACNSKDYGHTSSPSGWTEHHEELLYKKLSRLSAESVVEYKEISIWVLCLNVFRVRVYSHPGGRPGPGHISPNRYLKIRAGAYPNECIFAAESTDMYENSERQWIEGICWSQIRFTVQHNGSLPYSVTLHSKDNPKGHSFLCMYVKLRIFKAT